MVAAPARPAAVLPQLPPGAEVEYEPPRLYAKQREAIFCPERYAVVEASTKAGKTVGCLAWLLEQALRARPGQHFWWIAPVYSQTRIAYRRLRRGLEPWAFVANESELTLTLVNGAVVAFKSADHPDGLYGEDVYAAVLDEATRCKEDAWHAVRSTLTATGGPVRLIGNVKGRRNWAYRLARRAEAGEPGWHYGRITAYDAVAAGVLEGAEIEDARRTLPEAVFNELYLTQPSDDAGNPFGLEAIRKRVAPLSPAPPTGFGVDLAKSHDWSVIVGLDAAGRTCRFERFQAPWDETTTRVLGALGRVYGLVDATGVGDPIVERLQRAGANVEGFLFSSPSKQRLMEGLAVAIQQGEVTYPDGPLVAELEAFEYQYTRTGVRYAGPEGMTDDCVMALALAVHGRGQGGTTRFY